jgi:hypothetical protein
MSTLQVANIHLESTANNRIQFNGSNSFSLIAGGSTVYTVNTTSTSKTANGYTYLPNGLIMQWGNYPNANSTANVISFPLLFPTNVFSITVSSNTVGANVGIYAQNSSTFTVRTGSTTASPIFWQALGW